MVTEDYTAGDSNRYDYHTPESRSSTHMVYPTNGARAVSCHVSYIDVTSKTDCLSSSVYCTQASGNRPFYFGLHQSHRTEECNKTCNAHGIQRAITLSGKRFPRHSLANWWFLLTFRGKTWVYTKSTCVTTSAWSRKLNWDPWILLGVAFNTTVFIRLSQTLTRRHLAMKPYPSSTA